ncbi:LCC11_5 [Sanghuangporus sanghuang]
MFKSYIVHSLFVLSLTHIARSAVVSVDLTISNADLAPDGTTRSTVVANGQFPAPLISANTGDNLQLNVTDNLTDTSMHRATSIHWHGLFQKGTNEMDGPSFVNQCPIIPGNSFLYNFSVPGQSGTYWYHSHLSTQYCDGLRGPLVLYDPDDPHADLYDVDDESTVIVLADWYQNVSPSLFPNQGDVDPTPDTTTINGLGRNSNGDGTDPLSVVSVTQGTRYRFRVVSTSCYPTFTFSIDGHNLTIIEADGVETEPVTVDQLDIFPGQRYSIVVTADQSVANYWIRAQPSVGTTGFTNGTNSAILRYDGAEDADPTSIQNTEGTTLDEADLHPLVDPGAPGEPEIGGVDYALNLPIGIDLTTGEHTVNGVVYQSPTVPVLLQILSGTTSATDLLPDGSVYTLPGNSTIELSLPGGFPHPIHLHGHTFDVVRVAGSSDYNYDNPVRRDVVSIGTASDNVTIRFTTDNAGPWFLHCHIDWHLQAGLAVVFAEDVDNIASQNPDNADWDALCPDFNANNPDTAYAE